MTKIVTRTRKQAYERWIEALENGSYRQVHGSLRASTRDASGKLRRLYCCLGVLCDLARKDGGSKWRDDRGLNDAEADAQLFASHYALLPDPIRDFMGITRKQQQSLIDMNDKKRASFKEIAEYIRTTIMPKALERP